MNEKIIRQIVQYQLKDWYIRSCRLDIKTNRYIYEAYAPDQSVFTAYDPYYTLNINGIVAHVNIAADPPRLFNAPIIWSDENNELAHAFKNPLKGIMREGHKYIQRLGDPGNYKYVYKKTKKAINTIGENIEDKLETLKNGSSKDNKLSVYNGWWDTNETDTNKTETIKFFDRPSIGNTPLLEEQFPKKEDSYSLSSCKDETEFLNKRKKDLNECNDGPTSYYEENDSRYSNPNCGALAFAFEMRCRNYDVQAKTLDHGITCIDQAAIFHDKSGAWQAKCVCDDVTSRKNNYEGYTLQPHQFETFKEELLKEPKNSRGMISITYYCGGGHALNYERINDKLIIYDAQSNTQTIITKQTKELPSNCPIYYAGGISYFRTDDKEMHMGGYYDDEYSVQVRSLNDYVEPAFIGKYYDKDESVADFMKRQERLRELRKIKSENQNMHAKRKQELKEKIKRLAEDYRNQQIDEWHPSTYKTEWYETLINTAVKGFYGAVYAIQDLYEEIIWRLS